MKDAVGNELKIGDRVVMTDSHYKELLHGKITGFAPKTARVNVTAGRSGYGQGQEGNTVTKGGHQLCLVITREEFNAYGDKNHRDGYDNGYIEGIDEERYSSAIYRSNCDTD